MRTYWIDESQAHTLTRGVLQGSILGPLLFNIYIYDLPNVTKELSLESYVDNSKIFLSFSIVDAESTPTKLSEDVNTISIWCCSNSLIVNPAKTKLLLQGMQQTLERLPENFHKAVLDKEIRPVLNAKDLRMLYWILGCLMMNKLQVLLQRALRSCVK